MAEEKEGIIASWDDFEAFPWESVKLDLYDLFEFMSENLPEGMKITFCDTLWEKALDLVGTETMFRNLYVNPELVEAVFHRLGDIVYRQYETAVSLDCLGLSSTVMTLDIRRGRG